MSVRKLLSLSLALALVYSISFPARAELLKNFKMDGSIETRSFGINNESDRNSNADDYRSETRTRLMLGGSFDLLDDVHSRIQLLKNNSVFGSNGTGQGESLNTVQDNIDVVNAYVKIDKIFNHVDLTAGRQYYGRSDDLVIYYGANNDDILSVQSLDAFRADADIAGVAKVQGIAGKIADNGVNSSDPLVNSDTDVIGAEVNTDKVIPRGNLAAYFYDREIKGPGVKGNDNLEVYGLRAAGDLVLGLSYSAEGILNGGRNSTLTTPGNNKGYDGNAYLLALKFNKDFTDMPVRAGAEYGRGTDNFQAISAGKRFGIIWGEQTTVGPATSMPQTTGLADLKVADLSVGVNPIKKLGVDLSWYRFMADGRSTLVGNRTSIGTEYDLVLSWKHSENVALEVNAADFHVGDALQNAAPTGTSPITRLGADVKIKF